ncbi:MAG TPA: DMT family transporter [Gaiellaceae bacterium]|nr:DMT family transporter [Gaiellaceae bacterium]
MTAVVLALASAALFGAMTVSLRYALEHGAEADLAAFFTVATALLVALVAATVSWSWRLGDAWPFALAGVLGPGLSQTLFTLGVRRAGPSRASMTVGTAPLFSVAIALVFLGEPAVAGVVAGAVLIVAGGVLLALERDRPAHVARSGLLLALGSTIVFATRDNLVRHLALGTEAPPTLAAAATLAGGAVTIGAFVLARRARLHAGQLRPYLPAGVAFGLSYVCLFEAFYRGRVSVVTPLVATESLWGVGLSALLLRRHELVGPRLALAALLVVSGGALIGVFR